MTDQEQPTVEPTLTEPSPQEALDAREDEVLMQLDPGTPDEQQEDPRPEPEPEAKEQSSEHTEEQTQKADTGGLEEAWSVLRRDGFSKDDLAALSDEAIQRLADHRKKVQSDVDRLLTEAKQQQEASEDKQTPEESGAPDTAEAASDEPELEYLADAARVFAEHVGLDDEGADLLKKSYEQIIRPFAQQQQQMQEYMLSHHLEQLRSGLAEEFPQVADPRGENYQKVLDRMGDLYDVENPPDLRSLMEDAIALEFREELRNDRQAATDNIRSYRQNGAPSRPSGAGLVPEASPEDIEDQVLAMLDSDHPDRLERARRLTGR